MPDQSEFLKTMAYNFVNFMQRKRKITLIVVFHHVLVEHWAAMREVVSLTPVAATLRVFK